MGGSRKQEISPELTSVTKELFFVLSSRNIQISLAHVLSKENAADGPSRRLSRLDSRLTKEAWERVEKAFGGLGGHYVMLGKNGTPCPISRPTLSLSERRLTCSLKICSVLTTSRTLTVFRLLDLLALF